MIKTGAAYHAENQAALGELLAAVKKVRALLPSARSQSCCLTCLLVMNE